MMFIMFICIFVNWYLSYKAGIYFEYLGSIFENKHMIRKLRWIFHVSFSSHLFNRIGALSLNDKMKTFVLSCVSCMSTDYRSN